MEQALNGGPNFMRGQNTLETVIINCTLLSFKMQIILPGPEYIGILSIYLPFIQMSATVFIFSL